MEQTSCISELSLDKVSLDSSLEQSSCVSELLFSLDKVCRYKYGLLHIDYDPNYLKMKDQIYLLTEGDRFDLVTIQPTNETVVFDLEDFELVMECGKIYFLKPAPQSALTLEKCIIKKYISIENITSDNVSFSSELDFAEQRLIDLLKTEIGTKRLKMTCWPFVNVTLDTFLKECNVPHYIVLTDRNEYRLFDEKVYVATDPYECYYLTKFFKEKFSNDQNEAYLFEKPDKKSYLLKEIKNYYQTKEFSTSGSISNGSIVMEMEHEEAFVIFNPDSSRSVDDVVLPLESQKNNPSKTRDEYLNWHYQTIF